MPDGQRAAILEVAGACLGAVIDQEDPSTVLRFAVLADLARLEQALRELIPAVRTVMQEMEEATAQLARYEVPWEGPAALCDEPVVHYVQVYVRDSRSGLELASAVKSCPVHVLAYLARARHAVAPVAAGDGHGDSSVSFLPLSLTQEARCGDVTDFRTGFRARA